MLWLMHRYEEAVRVARDVIAIMPDNELCLSRLIEYETLSGKSRRADHTVSDSRDSTPTDLVRS